MPLTLGAVLFCFLIHEPTQGAVGGVISKGKRTATDTQTGVSLSGGVLSASFLSAQYGRSQGRTAHPLNGTGGFLH